MYREAIAAFTWLIIRYGTRFILPAIHGLSRLTDKTLIFTYRCLIICFSPILKTFILIDFSLSHYLKLLPLWTGSYWLDRPTKQTDCIYISPLWAQEVCENTIEANSNWLICEKQLFDANFVHFTLLKSQFQKSRQGGYAPISPLPRTLAASLTFDCGIELPRPSYLAARKIISFLNKI